MQFIPVVERINRDGLTILQEGTTVSDRSVAAEQFGRFLIAIFDEWVRRGGAATSDEPSNTG